eukprot:CAMPEP_0175291372 /NCGR_PEP_ID=MMETSP0093-20121207/56372_1 /TAXON_ID=311494 /ORGANISM="Alexandrium monilatum, Strain CCMP3105" /LENGTH=151 /DNA_ID=CAMNT_0016587121 /DNA_START=8 /DNA_END=464 /DNA_ORIENTATION=+
MHTGRPASTSAWTANQPTRTSAAPMVVRFRLHQALPRGSGHQEEGALLACHGQVLVDGKWGRQASDLLEPRKDHRVRNRLRHMPEVVDGSQLRGQVRDNVRRKERLEKGDAEARIIPAIKAVLHALGEDTAVRCPVVASPHDESSLFTNGV